MKTTTKKISDTRVELTVTLDASDLETARARAVEHLAADVKLSGFRKGKAPLAMVEKSLDPNAIASETIDIAVRTGLPAAFSQAKLAPIAIMGVNVTKYVPGESAEYVATADVLPEVKVGDYKKLKVKKPDATPSEKDVQDILDNIKQAYAEKAVIQRAAALGDEVIIDFVGKKDGEAFPGGTAKDYHLELGSGQFIPGFEEGIVGHSAGDKFDLELTFPKDYGEKSLAGQKTVFETLLKQVNEVKRPEENDELAHKCGNFKDMDELKADIKARLTEQNTYRLNEQYREELVRALTKASKVAAPEILIEDQLRLIKQDNENNAASRGMKLEQYIEATGTSMEEWEKQARAVAEDRVKASLVLQVLARDQGVQASDEEVEAKIAELKDVYRKSKEAMANLKKPEVRQEIKNRLILDKTMDLIVEANGGVAINQSVKAKQPAKSAGKDKSAKTARKATKTTKKAK